MAPTEHPLAVFCGEDDHQVVGLATPESAAHSLVGLDRGFASNASRLCMIIVRHFSEVKAGAEAHATEYAKQ